MVTCVNENRPPVRPEGDLGKLVAEDRKPGLNVTGCNRPVTDVVFRVTIATTATMAMKNSRRSFVSAAALLLTATASSVQAQFGGHSRNRGDNSGSGSQRSGDSNQRGPSPALVDPVAAIERELPSLRIDLKLTSDQTPLFDSFERQVRSTAEAGRMRARHLSAFRIDDGSTVTADRILSTIADDDAQRADAARLALEKMSALYAALTPDQQKQWNQRIIQALREPLGNS